MKGRITAVIFDGLTIRKFRGGLLQQADAVVLQGPLGSEGDSQSEFEAETGILGVFYFLFTRNSI